jgi:predicted nuclease of predicted toxin-antitoxin system
MRFLIDANMPRSTGGSIGAWGHEAIDVRDIGLGGAEDKAIAEYAQRHLLAIITRDFDFSDVRNYPPERFAGLVVLHVPEDATASAVLSVLEFLLRQTALLERLPGRLAIVEPSRVRFRPAL